MTTNAAHFYCNSVKVLQTLRDRDHAVIGMVQAHKQLALSIKSEGERALNCLGTFFLEPAPCAAPAATRVGAAANGMQYVPGTVHDIGAACTEEQRQACTQGSS